jgi:U4/U6.U5 tri-snRNP-associated protein 3
MSDSRYYNKRDTNEDVESYRSRRREEDRRHRGRSPSPPAAASKKINHADRDHLEVERAQRMARLRQEMKEEDRELAGLDTKVEVANVQKPQESIIEVKPEELEGLNEEEQMKKLLGFDGFGSTKGEAVADNKNTAARGVAAKNKARKYRQYMNRKNGFNRPLEKMG